MNYERLTEIDVKKMESDIEVLEHRRKLFLAFGIVLVVLSVLLFAAAVVGYIFAFKDIKQFDVGFFLLGQFGVTFGIFACAGGITLLVLRGSLLNRKIRNRKLAIEAFHSLHK